jgi:hypothetical protein
MTIVVESQESVPSDSGASVGTVHAVTERSLIVTSGIAVATTLAA